MAFLKKTQVGIDIFNDKLITCGYKFKEDTFYEFEQLFSKIRGITPLNYIERLSVLKELFRRISKSMGISFYKPAVFLSIPEEFSSSSNYNTIRENLTSVILDSGWSNIYFVQELMAAAIGCDLPYNKLKSDGLYAKSVFIYSKKNSVTFGIGCAGGIFETVIILSRLSDIGQVLFEDTINKVTRNNTGIPQSFTERPYSKEVKNRLKASWEADVDKTIYLMASDGEKDEFINRIYGFDFVAPSGYQAFTSLGLDKIRKTTIGD